MACWVFGGIVICRDNKIGDNLGINPRLVQEVIARRGSPVAIAADYGWRCRAIRVDGHLSFPEHNFARQLVKSFAFVLVASVFRFLHFARVPERKAISVFFPSPRGLAERYVSNEIMRL